MTNTASRSQPARATCKRCDKPLTNGQRIYCSRSCTSKSSGRTGKGADGLRWNGGRHVTASGYVRLWDPDTAYRYEHRVVAEQMLGRPLERGEQVHHLNGNKTDNRPENLVILGIREHAQLHEAHHFQRASRWSVRFDACIDCGRTSVRHASHGRCRSCGKKWGMAHPGGLGRIDSGANR